MYSLWSSRRDCWCISLCYSIQSILTLAKTTKLYWQYLCDCTNKLQHNAMGPLKRCVTPMVKQTMKCQQCPACKHRRKTRVSCAMGPCITCITSDVLPLQQQQKLIKMNFSTTCCHVHRQFLHSTRYPSLPLGVCPLSQAEKVRLMEDQEVSLLQFLEALCVTGIEGPLHFITWRPACYRSWWWNKQKLHQRAINARNDLYVFCWMIPVTSIFIHGEASPRQLPAHITKHQSSWTRWSAKHSTW